MKRRDDKEDISEESNLLGIGEFRKISSSERKREAEEGKRELWMSEEKV